MPKMRPFEASRWAEKFAASFSAALIHWSFLKTLPAPARACICREPQACHIIGAGAQEGNEQKGNRSGSFPWAAMMPSAQRVLIFFTLSSLSA